MLRRVLGTVSLALLSPAFVLASATFPASSVWLSDSSPSVGDKVRIHAVVYNETSAALTGSVVFLVDDKDNGTELVSLAPGESEVISSLWTATEGEHSFSARFASANGAAQSQSVSISASVAAPPSAAKQALAEAKTVSAKVASTSIPIVSAVANRVFETTESIRNAGIEYLEKKSANAPSTQKATSSPVERFEKPNTADASDADTPSVVSNIAQTASAAALFTLKSMWLFYPLLVIALLLIFRWLYRWATGPRI